ncbi:RND family transporter [Chloroflexota bacterium]
MRRIARFCCTAATPIIIFVAIINIVALASFYRFELDTDFLNFFASDNPKTQEYNLLKEKYETGGTISMLIEQEHSLLDKENLLKVFILHGEIEKLDGVSRVESFIPSEISTGNRIFQVDQKFIEHHFDILEDYIQRNYSLIRKPLSDDKSKAIITINLELDATGGEILSSLKALVEKENDWTLSLAGGEVIKDTLWTYFIRIIIYLPPCAVLLILLVFSLILKSPKFTIMAIIPAGLGALWTLGTIFWSGQELNLLSIISPIFIVVMGAADGLHCISHFIDNMGKYSDRRQLVEKTLDMVGMPIFLTTITTMAGFASLTWTDVLPMRQMGIFVSLGIGYAGVLSLFFLPAVLSKMNLPAKAPPARESNISKLILLASKRKYPIVISFLIIIIISVSYIPKLEVVSNQLMFFKEDSPIRQTFDKVDKYFGGALPLTAEIVSDKGIDTLRDHVFAEEILDMEREMERLPGIDSVFSFFDVVADRHQMITGKKGYPENPQFIQRVLMQMDDEDIEDWISYNGFRMIIKTDELEALDLNQLDNFIVDYTDIRLVTGMPVLFNEMNTLVVESQIRSLGLALVLIFIMLLVTIRRLKAALVAMLPIAITILAILSMLAITDFDLNIVTAILSSIAIGVGVDYAIHLISGIYYFRRQGLENRASVDSALLTLTRPILANAFGLAIGLSVFFLSPLRIHTQVASIMWIAMVISSIGALLLIPLFYRK